MLHTPSVDVLGLFFLSTELKYNPPQPNFVPHKSKTSVASAEQKIHENPVFGPPSFFILPGALKKIGLSAG